MLILSDKWITAKCQPPDLRAWVADRAAIARLGPDNPAVASGTSQHPPPSPRAGSAAPSDPPGSETHANAVGGCRRLRPIPGSTSFPPARGRRPRRRTPGNSTRHTARFRHQPGLQGVALDVATATQEISLALDGRTLETTLPEVAHEAIAPIEVG